MSFTTSVLRAIVKMIDDTKSALTAQIEDMEEGDADADLDVYEPVGVHFKPSADEDMLAFEVGGTSDNRVVMGASQRGHRPQDLTDDGTGGLHYVGTWKVFLDSDGTVHLGERDAGDFVALASKVDDEIARIWDLLTTWTVAPQDGGAALQAAAIAEYTNVGPVGSEVVKVV
jgi:hypothetical protein